MIALFRSLPKIHDHEWELVQKLLWKWRALPFLTILVSWQPNSAKLALLHSGVPKPRGGEGWGGYISPNNLTVYPPTIWVWSSSAICIPSNSVTMVCIWAQVCTWIRGKKVFHFWWRPFFLMTALFEHNRWLHYSGITALFGYPVLRLAFRHSWMKPQDTWTSLSASVSLHSLATPTDQGFSKDEVPWFWSCLLLFRLITCIFKGI